VVIGAGALMAFGVPGLKSPLRGLFASTQTDVLTAPPLRLGKLAVIVKERGNLESAANKEVYCAVEGGTSIIKILPEGTRVKEGEIVCELDSASLKDLLNNQKISTQQAEASYKQVKLTREVAQVAVEEYVKGIFKQEKATADGEIALAKSDLTRAIDRLDWSTRMYDKGYVSLAQNIADKLALERAKFEKEQSETKLDVLLRFTRDKTVKELESDVEKAKADELSKQSTFELERTKEAKLERQIAACTLKAPGDGIVVYANEQGRMGQNSVQVEEGAAVRERQKIFSLPDTTKMRVNTKIHESMVNKITPGLRSLIRVVVDGAGQALKGQVTGVAPMADAASNFGSDIKVYTTFVAIEGDTAKLNLRPGMSAAVEILVEELDDVLSVPVQAILQRKDKNDRDKNFVFVKEGDGFRRVEVTLGISNDQHVEVKRNKDVKDGVKEGDIVAMSPSSLLTEDERREALSVASKDAAKNDFAGDPNAKGSPKGAGPASAGTSATGEPKAAKKKGARGGAGGGAMGALMQKLSPEVRQKLRDASDEERVQILKGAGLSDAEIEQMQQMRRNMQNGGGPSGPGGPGGGRPGGPGQ